MKTSLTFLAVLAILLSGCGASKDYVNEQIQASETRTSTQLASVKGQSEANAADVAKLQALAAELSDKTELAINKAKGFENYQVIWSGEINFSFDSWAITGTAEQTLMEAGQAMTNHPNSVIEIGGYTDKTGPSSYNLVLGERRADAAKRFLADQYGVSLYRMFTISYGEDKPVSLPDQRNANEKNRRVTLKVWGEL